MVIHLLVTATDPNPNPNSNTTSGLETTATPGRGLGTLLQTTIRQINDLHAQWWTFHPGQVRRTTDRNVLQLRTTREPMFGAGMVHPRTPDSKHPTLPPFHPTTPCPPACAPHLQTHVNFLVGIIFGESNLDVGSTGPVARTAVECVGGAGW